MDVCIVGVYTCKATRRGPVIGTISKKEDASLSKESEIIDIIKTILKHQAFPETVVESSSELYEDGVGLDSLCVAELSATLEKAYGSDPYSSKILPRTVGDIVTFYSDS